MRPKIFTTVMKIGYKPVSVHRIGTTTWIMPKKPSIYYYVIVTIQSWKVIFLPKPFHNEHIKYKDLHDTWNALLCINHIVAYMLVLLHKKVLNVMNNNDIAVRSSGNISNCSFSRPLFITSLQCWYQHGTPEGSTGCCLARWYSVLGPHDHPQEHLQHQPHVLSIRRASVPLKVFLLDV